MAGVAERDLLSRVGLTNHFQLYRHEILTIRYYDSFLVYVNRIPA